MTVHPVICVTLLWSAELLQDPWQGAAREGSQSACREPPDSAEAAAALPAALHTCPRTRQVGLSNSRTSPSIWCVHAKAEGTVPVSEPMSLKWLVICRLPVPKEDTASIDEALKAAEWLTEEELQQEQQKIIASWARRSFKRIPGRPCHASPDCLSDTQEPLSSASVQPLGKPTGSCSLICASCMC